MTNQLERILPGLFRWVSRLRGPQHPVNSYVVVTKHGAILIDPAADLTPAVLDGQRVTDILITHLQKENAAGCLHFPNARVHVPAGDEYLCRGIAAYEKHITNWPPPWEWETRGNFKGHLAGARNERPVAKPLALAKSLAPGTRILGFRVLATPGHGKNAVTLLATIAGRRVAFCGDLIYGDGRLWNWFDSDWDYGLQGGPRTLRKSATRLLRAAPAVLCPTHGPVIHSPRVALDRLRSRLKTVLQRITRERFNPRPFRVEAKPSRVEGFRELSPHLQQWTQGSGNCALLLSDSGHGLLVDDGLCQWIPLRARAARHRQVMTDVKRAFGLRRIEMVIVTHYHGDHIENIPEIVATDRSEVVCLDTVAEVIEHPERFNLASALPWYGTRYDTVKVDRRVKSGTRIRWREYELEIRQLGGQTWYSSAITTTVDGRRVVFCGDSFGGDSVEPPLSYNDCEPATRGWYYAARVLLDLAPDLVVCGHGDALRNPVPLLRRKCALWRKRMDQYRALSARTNLREFFDPVLRLGGL